ncbi:hypothetical protein [Brachybacterium hainanense]|uniref:DUF58 domain-containing protein n=1 Tax=Brachybacterium hainanense TaxID=1541174 RepID=A0ABV6R999_9MICO
MLRLLRMIGLGLLLAGAVIWLITGTDAAWWTLPLGLTLAIFTSVLLGVSRTTSRLASVPPQLVQEALSAGRTGAARIDGLRRTGTMINDQPVCDLELTVQPRLGPAYRTRRRDIIPLTEIPQVQPGLVRPVVIPAEGEPDVQFVDGQVPIDSLPVVPAASSALPLRVPAPGPLRVDGTRQRPIVSIDPRTRPLRVLVFTLVMLLTAGLALLPYRESVEQTLAVLPEGTVRMDARSPEGISRGLAQIQREVGHEGLLEVTVSPDFLSADVPVRAGELATDAWTSRHGILESEGPATVQPDSPGEQFSASEIAWEALWPAAEQAAAEQGLEGPGDTIFTIRRATGHDMDSEDFGLPVGPVEIIFSVGDEYTSTTYTMRGDGSGLSAI